LGDLPGPRDRVLTDDGIVAYWRAATRLPYPYGPDLILTALCLNEVADATWSEFDLRNRLWIIPAERMKGKNAGKRQARLHAVPITCHILAVLESLPRFTEGNHLFSTTFGRSSAWVNTKVKEVLTSACCAP